MPATALTVAPPVEPVRTSGLTRASKRPRMTLAFGIALPVVALTSVSATVPLRAASRVVEAGRRVGVVAGVGVGRGAGAALGEDRPDEVGVVAVVAVEVGREDAVTGVEEARVRGGQRHAVGDEPRRDLSALGRAVARHQRLAQVPQGRGPDLAVGVHLGTGQVVADVAERGRVLVVVPVADAAGRRCR